MLTTFRDLLFGSPARERERKIVNTLAVLRSNKLMKTIFSYLLPTKNTKTKTIQPLLPLLLTFHCSREILNEHLKSLNKPKNEWISRKRDFTTSPTLLQWAIKLGCVFEKKSNQLCRYAGMSDNVSVIEWAVRNDFTCDASVANTAARYGSLKTLMWLKENFPDFPFDDDICAHAAFNGHTHVLLYLRTQSPLNSWNSKTSKAAAAGGRLDTLRFLMFRSPPCPFDENICDSAALYGHVKIIQFLVSLKNPKIKIGSSTCASAAKGGHLGVLRYLRGLKQKCDWDDQTVFNAAAQGHVKILRWLVFEYPIPIDTYSTLKHEALRSAVRHGQLEIFKNFKLHTSEIPFYSDLCTIAAEFGFLHILKWFRAQNPVFPWSVETLEIAIEKRKLEVVRFLLTQNPPCPHSRIDKTQTNNNCENDNHILFDIAARNNDVEMIKLIRSIKPTLPWTDETCDIAAALGHVKVLASLRNQNPPCPWSEKTCFSAAKNGQVKVLNWLRNQNPSCPWNPIECYEVADKNGHEKVKNFISSKYDK